MDTGHESAVRRRRRRDAEVEESDYPSGSLVGAAVFGLFLLLLIVSPLPMGANRDWAWAPLVMAFGILALLVAAGVDAPRKQGFAEAERGPLLATIACFGIVIAVALLQMSTLVSLGASARLYARAREILGQAHAPIPSVAAVDTLYALLRCVACGLIFLMARAFCRDEARSRLLLFALLASAVVVLGYALLAQVTTQNCYVGSFLKKQGEFVAGTDRCVMSGTFVNSNSFGCFVGMALVTALALLFGKPASKRAPVSDEDGEFDEGGSMLGWLTGTKVALIAVSLLCLGGMLISASRAGFAATVAGVVVLGFLLARGSSLSRAALNRAVLAGVAIAIVVGVIAGGVMIRKTATFKNADTLNRVVIWRVSIDAIKQSPLLGWGLGTYADAYTLNQPVDIPQPNDKAHSTPIEIIVELGIPAGLAAIAAVLIPWGVGLRGALRQRRQRYLPAAAFVAAGVAILHSTVDFSLQIPAIGFFVSALLGLGWAQTFVHSAAADPVFTEDA